MWEIGAIHAQNKGEKRVKKEKKLLALITREGGVLRKYIKMGNEKRRGRRWRTYTGMYKAGTGSGCVSGRVYRSNHNEWEAGEWRVGWG